MTDKNPPSSTPVPASGALDLALSVILPFVGVSFLLSLLLYAVRNSIPERALMPSMVGVIAVSLVIGVVNAARWYRKTYRR